MIRRASPKVGHAIRLNTGPGILAGTPDLTCQNTYRSGSCGYRLPAERVAYGCGYNSLVIGNDPRVPARTRWLVMVAQISHTIEFASQRHSFIYLTSLLQAHHCRHLKSLIHIISSACYHQSCNLSLSCSGGLEEQEASCTHAQLTENLVESSTGCGPRPNMPFSVHGLRNG